MDNSILIIFILLIFSFYIIYNNCISKVKEEFDSIKISKIIFY